MVNIYLPGDVSMYFMLKFVATDFPAEKKIRYCNNILIHYVCAEYSINLRHVEQYVSLASIVVIKTWCQDINYSLAPAAVPQFYRLRFSSNTTPSHVTPSMKIDGLCFNKLAVLCTLVYVCTKSRQCFMSARQRNLVRGYGGD